MKILGIIPVRLESKRFPNKPLAMIGDKPIIQHIYESAQKTKLFSGLVVATDSDEIVRIVRTFGGHVFKTEKEHLNGTERCAEVYNEIRGSFELVINIQGDQPFFQKRHIELIIECMDINYHSMITTLIYPIINEKDLYDQNIVKADVDFQARRIRYFERGSLFTGNDIHYFKHIGIYGYKPHVLQEIAALEATGLEKLYGLEQLRWLENGYPIHFKQTSIDVQSVDCEDDLKKFKL